MLLLLSGIWSLVGLLLKPWTVVVYVFVCFVLGSVLWLVLCRIPGMLEVYWTNFHTELWKTRIHTECDGPQDKMRISCSCPQICPKHFHHSWNRNCTQQSENAQPEPYQHLKNTKMWRRLVWKLPNHRRQITAYMTRPAHLAAKSSVQIQAKFRLSNFAWHERFIVRFALSVLRTNGPQGLTAQFYSGPKCLWQTRISVLFFKDDSLWDPRVKTVCVFGCFRHWAKFTFFKEFSILFGLCHFLVSAHLFCGSDWKWFETYLYGTSPSTWHCIGAIFLIQVPPA